MKCEMLLVEFQRRPLTSSPDERQKSKHFHFYTLCLDHFCVLIVKVRCKLCKIHGEEKLLSYLFSPYGVTPHISCNTDERPEYPLFWLRKYMNDPKFSKFGI